MIIAILILSGIVTLIIYFRRHGNGKLLQYGEVLDSIERKAKCKQGNYNPDKRYIP